MATQVAKQMAIRARRPAVSADIPVVAAKITAPGMPDWALTRPRITKLIAEGRRWCPLTLITAPAGSGKTMAMALWAAAEPGTVAWVTVDDPDQAPILAVETLTERELEVLRHASGLLSNAELASKMYITVNTVKTHLKHIYRKLETTRRAEAIRRARQLELI